MRKICLLCLLFFLFSPITSIAHAESEKEWICLANYCYLYEEASFSSSKIEKIYHKDILLLEDPQREYLDNKGKVFYKVLSVNNSEKTGYIFSDFVVENYQNIEIFPEFNASLKNDTPLFEVDGESFVETSTTLKKGTRVYLYEGFDNDADGYNAVAIKNGSELLYGYVKKSDVAPDGINPAIIYAITIALAIIGIIMALLFMKNKKKKNVTKT